jgi:hypothetical protein
MSSYRKQLQECISTPNGNQTFDFTATHFKMTSGICVAKSGKFDFVKVDAATCNLSVKRVPVDLAPVPVQPSIMIPLKMGTHCLDGSNVSFLLRLD